MFYSIAIVGTSAVPSPLACGARGTLTNNFIPSSLEVIVELVEESPLLTSIQLLLCWMIKSAPMPRALANDRLVAQIVNTFSLPLDHVSVQEWELSNGDAALCTHLIEVDSTANFFVVCPPHFQLLAMKFGLPLC